MRTLYNPRGEDLGNRAAGVLASLATLVGCPADGPKHHITRGREIEALGLLIIRWASGSPFVENVRWMRVGAGLYLVATLGLRLLISMP